MTYRYTVSGLDYIYLKNGYKKHKTPYGPGVSIANIAGLHDAITRLLCTRIQFFKGQEARYLRKSLDVTQAVLGNMLGVDSQTIARWEKNEHDMPEPAQRLLRLICMEKFNEKSPIHSFIERLNNLEDKGGNIVMEEKGDKWRIVA
ncbi:MAG: transcriptional regulator [Alphaproteobacteria bacterium]|nr:transcriptional regulator [Alphaproteobacteria bacterium]